MKVYKYALRPPANPEPVFEQMRAAIAYRNRLVENSIAFRDKMRGVEATLGLVPIDAERARLDAAHEAVRKARSASRSRAVPPEVSTELADAKKAFNEARKRFNEQRSALREDRKKLIEKLAEERHERDLALRASSGVYWGTYQLAEIAMKQSDKETPLFDDGVPRNPSFVRWSGEGEVSVQITSGGLPVASLGLGGTLVRVKDVSAHKNPTSRRAAKRRFVELHLRIGSNPDRTPIWAVFPGIFHRPLPADGIIKRVTVKRKLVGPREVWYALFTVDRTPRKSNGTAGRVALDLGWRKREDGKRVAAVLDEQGIASEVRIPGAIFDTFDKADAVRGERDVARDEVRGACLRILKEDPNIVDPAQVENLALWRSPRRFVRLWSELTGLKNVVTPHRPDRSELEARLVDSKANWERAKGSNGFTHVLSAYVEYDRLAWTLESELRTSALHRRLDFFRVTARDLANEYSVVVLENFDLAKVAKRKGKAPEKDLPDATHSARHSTAAGEFRDAVLNAFGGFADYVPCEYTTMTCASCGALEDFDRRELEHTCSKCGSRWDQDHNACRNLLAYSEPEKVRPVDEAYEGKHAKRKREKREREKREREAAE